VGGPLEAKLKKLQEFYWSDADPDGRGFVCLAHAYRRDGNSLEALRILRDGRKRHPELASGHVVAGWTHAEQGDSAEAEEAFRAALELDSQNVAALRGLGDLLAQGGELEEALGLLQALQPLDPLDGELPQRMDDLEGVLAARIAGAEEVADEGDLERRPVWEDGEGIAEELNWDVAALQEDESEPSEELDPGARSQADPGAIGSDGVPVASRVRDDALVTRTMGDIFFKQGLLDEAAEVFGKLLEQDPDDEELLGKLEKVQARLRGEEIEEEKGATSVAPDLIVPIEELAPGLIVSIEALAPDVIVPIEALAPDVIVPIEALALDSSPDDPALDAFEAWLDELP